VGQQQRTRADVDERAPGLVSTLLYSVATTDSLGTVITNGVAGGLVSGAATGLLDKIFNKNGNR